MRGGINKSRLVSSRKEKKVVRFEKGRSRNLSDKGDGGPEGVKVNMGILEWGIPEVSGMVLNFTRTNKQV